MLGQPSTLGAAHEWYLLFELLGGVVVDQSQGEGDGVVVTHQCEQHSCVGGGADLSHDLYFPGFGPEVWRRSCCNEGGASGSNTNEGKVGVSRLQRRQLPALPSVAQMLACCRSR